MHIPVLLREVIDGLNISEGARIIDCTLGGGGYSSEIAKRIGKEGKLLAIDLDERAVESFRRESAVQKWEDRVVLEQGNFADVVNIANKAKFGLADALIADLGFSSIQLEEGKRGLSFMKDEPLFMNYDASSERTAAMIVNSYPESELARIIHEYSGERFSRRIAKNIVIARKKKRILTTKELVDIVMSSVPKNYERSRIHPATRTFLALRVEVNRELENLQKLLDSIEQVVRPGGRVAVVTFQSLEDRMVKHTFRNKQKAGVLKNITKKPIVPTEDEIKKNIRARSAKLRVAQIYSQV